MEMSQNDIDRINNFYKKNVTVKKYNRTKTICCTDINEFNNELNKLIDEYKPYDIKFFHTSEKFICTIFYIYTETKLKGW